MQLNRPCYWAVLLAAFALAACSSMNTRVGSMLSMDTNLEVTFEVHEQINPDQNHRSSPVYIRLYELKSSTAFERADFLELYENDAAVLGGDMVARQELSRIVPGESRTDKFVIDPNARYVGLVAEFYQYQNARYKVVFPVTQTNVVRDSVRVEISDNNLLLRSVH